MFPMFFPIFFSAKLCFGPFPRYSIAISKITQPQIQGQDPLRISSSNLASQERDTEVHFSENRISVDLNILSQCSCVTDDTQTDRQTDRQIDTQHISAIKLQRFADLLVIMVSIFKTSNSPCPCVQAYVTHNLYDFTVTRPAECFFFWLSAIH